MADDAQGRQDVRTRLVGKEQAPVLAANELAIWVTSHNTILYLGFKHPEERLPTPSESTEEPGVIDVRCLATVVLPHEVALEFSRVLGGMTATITRAMLERPGVPDLPEAGNEG